MYMATLEQILRSRDERQSRQKELLALNPGKTLVCLTVVMPGQDKRGIRSLIVAQAAMTALLQHFGADKPFVEVRDLETGFEAFLLTEASATDAKRAVCRIEDEHPLGRLFDLDVITRDGPLTRCQIGEQERRCLLCPRPARECMRLHRHDYAELQHKIDQMIEAYVR